MNCNQVDKKLIFFLENELSSSETEQVEKHITTCTECSAKLDYIKESFSFLDNIKEVSSKPFLYTRIKSRLTTVIEMPAKKFVIPVSLAAMLILGIIMGSLVANKSFSIKTNVEYDVAYLFNDNNLEHAEQFLID